MKFEVEREKILVPLQQLIGVIERKQTLPILANVLLRVETETNTLHLTGTDTELQMMTVLSVSADSDGATTVPAKKLLDICRLSAKKSLIRFHYKDPKFLIHSDSSRFSLGTLPAEHFPFFDTRDYVPLFKIESGHLKAMLDKTVFCMATQDVRFFLNGLMLTVEQQQLNATASDGHRLATDTRALDEALGESQKFLMPRKGVLELFRLLNDGEEPVDFELSDNAVRIRFSGLEFSAKLIEGRLPDYSKAIPETMAQSLLVDKIAFKDALSRVSVLTGDDYRGIAMDIQSGHMTLSHRNPEQEEAEERLFIEYNGEPFSLGFNVSYIQDAVSHIDATQVKMAFSGAGQGCLLTPPDNSPGAFVVMPMRL